MFAIPPRDENQAEKSLDPGHTKVSRKRIAGSPIAGDMKRSAFGDITNAVKANGPVAIKEKIAAKAAKPPRKSLRVLSKQEKKEETKLSKGNKSVTTVSNEKDTGSVTSLPIDKTKLCPPPGSLDTCLKNLYIAAEQSKLSSLSQSPCGYYEIELSPRRKNLEHSNHDLENIDNPLESPVYALAIFEYMRARQNLFPVTKYLSKQKELTPDMRAILVDWMVEVQENFELNHETLYLAVKLVDLYLQNVETTKDILQLIGATAILIAAKFDERYPPSIDDFMYICDDAYNRSQMLEMERALLHAVGFDINVPISYRFLRRYAKCSKTNMQTLTLARFILELSLQCYDLVDANDSLLAASALWLAFKMNKSGGWTKNLLYYTSHEEQEIVVLARRLNNMVEESRAKKLQTIWQKYSHQIFYEVAKTPLLTDQQISEEEKRINKENTPQV